MAVWSEGELPPRLVGYEKTHTHSPAQTKHSAFIYTHCHVCGGERLVLAHLQ